MPPRQAQLTGITQLNFGSDTKVVEELHQTVALAERLGLDARFTSQGERVSAVSSEISQSVTKINAISPAARLPALKYAPAINVAVNRRTKSVPGSSATKAGQPPSVTSSRSDSIKGGVSGDQRDPAREYFHVDDKGELVSPGAPPSSASDDPEIKKEP